MGCIFRLPFRTNNDVNDVYAIFEERLKATVAQCIPEVRFQAKRPWIFLRNIDVNRIASQGQAGKQTDDGTRVKHITIKKFVKRDRESYLRGLAATEDVILSPWDVLHI